MKTTLLLLVAVFVTIPGCGPDSAEPSDNPIKEAASLPEAKKVPVGKNLWLEIQGERRRVVVDAHVCLREGQLELFLCRKHTKEHEAILAADIDARDLHKALLVAGAQPGTPVRFQPQFQAATGPKIRVTVEYQQKGKPVTAAAQSWIRDLTTKKEMKHDWVFAGSVLVANQELDREPFYAANSGDVICLSNFEGAMLDLPINSPQENADLVFEAMTERIPPIDTPVRVFLELKK